MMSLHLLRANLSPIATPPRSEWFPIIDYSPPTPIHAVMSADPERKPLLSTRPGDDLKSQYALKLGTGAVLRIVAVWTHLLIDHARGAQQPHWRGIR